MGKIPWLHLLSSQFVAHSTTNKIKKNVNPFAPASKNFSVHSEILQKKKRKSIKLRTLHNIHKNLWPSLEKSARFSADEINIKMFLLKSLNHKFQMAPNKTKLFLPLSLNSMFPLFFCPHSFTLRLSTHFLSRLLLAWNFFPHCLSASFWHIWLDAWACGLRFVHLIDFPNAYFREDLNNLVRFNQLVPGGEVSNLTANWAE